MTLARVEPTYHTLKTGMVILVVVAFILGLGVGRIATLENGKFGKVGSTLVGQSELRLRQQMRALWSDHVFLTRNYLVAAAADSADQTVAAEQLLRNQEDIGGLLAPYYGDEASAQVTQLLKEHIMGAVALIDSVKSRNIDAQAEAEIAWQANADELANLLNQLNPDHWPLEPVRILLYDHLNHTKAEVAARLAREYESDLAAYQLARAQALSIADALSGGIIRQQPSSFGR